MKLEGIHHITAITGDAPRNVEFYAGVLGLRLVKKTVNQDDPTVYHLFYADEDASPGADALGRSRCEKCPHSRRAFFGQSETGRRRAVHADGYCRGRAQNGKRPGAAARRRERDDGSRKRCERIGVG